MKRLCTTALLGTLLMAAAAPLWAQAEAQTGTLRPAPPPVHDTVPAKAAACMACHGPDGGQPIAADYPKLAGQTARYIYLQLRDFQEGRRSNELMTPMVAGLSRDDMRELGNFFAHQKPAPQVFTPEPDKVLRGKAKADETLCTMCHLGGFTGQNEIPRVMGQNPAYVIKQLSDFKARRRTNDAGNMTSVSNTLSDSDIVDLAHYLASL